MAFFGKVSRKNRLDSASRDVATRMPTGFGETVRTAFGQSVGNELSLSILNDINTARADLLEEAEKISGLSSRGMKNKQGADANPREKSTLFREQYDKWRKSNPDAPEYPVSDDAVDQHVQARRQERRDASAFARAGESGFASGAVRFLSGTAGLLVDPINILSMGIAGTSSTVIRTALKLGAISAGSEVPIQAAVQGFRTTIGEQPSGGEAAVAIASAGVGGAALGGVIAGIGRGVRRLRSNRELLEQSKNLPPEFRTQEVKDAEAVLTYLDELERVSPFPDTPAGRSEHARRLAQVYEALKSGKPVAEAFDVPLSRSADAKVKVKEGEPVADFMERVRKTDPETFKRVDDIAKSVNRLEAQLDKAVKAAAILDPALVAAGKASVDAAQALKKAVKEKADPRKVKKLKGKADKAVDKALEKKVKQLAATQKSGAKRIKLIEAQLKDLTEERVKLIKKIDKSIKKVDPFTRQIEENRIALTRIDLPKGVKDINEFGQLIRALAMANAHKGTRLGSAIGEKSRIIQDIIEEGDTGTQARVDLMEAQVRELSKVEDGQKYTIADDEGVTRQVTAKEILEEIKEDQKLVSELKSCIAGALI